MSRSLSLSRRPSMSLPRVRFVALCACVGWAVACSAHSTPEPAALSPSSTADGSAAPDAAAPASFSVLESSVLLAEPTLSQTDAEKFAHDRRAFALNLYQQVKGEADNTFFSPFSISTALAMAYVGARGQTHDEMARALSFSAPDEALHAGFNAVQSILGQRAVAPSENSVGLTLEINNDIWAHVDPGLRPLQSYADALALNYASPVKLVNFDVDDGETARQTINGEVSRQTHGTIEELLPQGSITAGHTTMVLTNAIYFKAAWAAPFLPEATSPGLFETAAGAINQVAFMHAQQQVDYARVGNVSAVRLPYAGQDVALTVLLPDVGAWAQVDTELSVELLEALDAAYSSTMVSLALPKLSMRSALGLKEPLQALGMVQAFEEGAADFSGVGPAQVYIQDVLHQAFIELDESGTEAGAATAVIFGGESAAPESEVEFVVDRPFVLVLEDVPTHTVLFMGRVTDP